MNKNACPCEETAGVCIVVQMCGCAVVYSHRSATTQLCHYRRLRSHHRIILRLRNIATTQPHILAVTQHHDNTTAEICNRKYMQLHNNITAKPQSCTI